MLTKVVNLPVEVPLGDYCWPPNTEEEHASVNLCPHLECSGGTTSCKLEFDIDTQGGKPILKDPACAALPLYEE
jgi:hypothetical protein